MYGRHGEQLWRGNNVNLSFNLLQVSTLLNLTSWESPTTVSPLLGETLYPNTIWGHPVKDGHRELH